MLDNLNKTEQALLTAMMQQNVAEVDKLLKQHESGELSLNLKLTLGSMPLLIVAIKGCNSDIVIRLLQCKEIDVNQAGDLGRTPLMHALNKCRLDVIKELLKRPDLDLYAKNEAGRDALTLCAWMPNYIMFEGPVREVENKFFRANTFESEYEACLYQLANICPFYAILTHYYRDAKVVPEDAVKQFGREEHKRVVAIHNKKVLALNPQGVELRQMVFNAMPAMKPMEEEIVEAKLGSGVDTQATVAESEAEPSLSRWSTLNPD